MSLATRLARAICALIVCAGMSGGCGAGAHKAKVATSSTAVTTPPPLPYSWLVRTQGQPPSIARENLAHGTAAWRLPGPPSLLGGEAHGAVAGYVARQAVVAGETERVYVSAPGAHIVTLSVYRMGWYQGRGGRLVLHSEPLPATRQPPCTHRSTTGLTECRWRPTLSFVIPPALPSGVYIVKLDASDGAQADCIFVVRSPRRARLLVELPTASWEAYNSWGGDSLYPGGKPVAATGSTQGVEVSFDRPYATQTGAGQFFIREVAMVRFLEREGFPVSYTTIDSIDADPAQVGGARGLIDVGHSEYWSARDARVFARARDRGTNLLFFSSDTMAWLVRFARATAASSESGAPDRRIIAYKEYAARDPDRLHPSGLFPLGGANLVGSAYDGCITPRVAQPGPPVYRLYAWAPAPGLQPRWLFANTGVTAATRIPGVVGYELDERARDAPRSTSVVGEGAGACALANEPSPVRGTLAQSTLYTARSGAFVFATGTLGWLYALSPVPQASPDAPSRADPRVVAMARNLLARALNR
jgi:N,N-dimethylformamidase beta subunit-like protein